MRSICRQKHRRIQVQAGDFLDIPLSDKSVDIIVSSYAFHHLTPRQKETSIREMKRVLRPGGRIVIADLMFRSNSEAERIKWALRESGHADTAEEIEDEHPGLLDDLSSVFDKAGFAFRSEQLTPSVWVLCALLRNG